MFQRKKIHAELEEQRCLIERQQVQIQRLQRQLQLQAQLTAVIQSELDAMRVTSHPPQPSTKSRSRSNGNAHPIAGFSKRA
jgi:hypothetical protein